MATTFSVENRGDVTIINVNGSMTFFQMSESLSALIKDLIKNGCKKFVLNGAGVPSVDSTGIGNLIGAVAALHGHGEMKLAGLKKADRLLETFRILFKGTYRNVDEAMKSPW